ncbi:MAG: VWA domain-containing protein [Candidatus Thioglobus sp.]|nr:VWA domain-containing protein [Candidatus Thioglobus sp.]
MAEIEFIRPLWLLAIPLVLLVWWFFVYKNSHFSNWQNVIGKHLLPRISQQQSTKNRTNFLLPILLILTIIGLSGLSFFQQNTPIYQEQKTTLIILDASPSMNATDVVPSRLKRGIVLIKQFLKIDTGRVMLMTFAAEPYLISPPSIDDKPLLNLLQGFNTQALPRGGSRLDLAFKYAAELLSKKNTNTNILLLTDAENVSSKAFQAAKDLGQKVSIIAISQAKTIEFEYQKIRQSTSTNKRLLRLLAQSTGGLYQELNVENVDNFVRFNASNLFANKVKQENQKASVAVDSGIYFALILLPLFLLFFSRELKR